MPSAQQIKKALQPLLRRNPDLALLHRFVVIKPVHHIQRGIYFKSGSGDRFDPFWTVNVLFAPRLGSFGLTWAREVYASPLRSGFHSYHSDVSEILCEQIERVALPLLRQVQTIDDFVAFNTAERFPMQQLDAFPAVKIFVDIARGDIEAALKIWESKKRSSGFASDWPKTYELITKTLHPMLVANDRAGLAQCLGDFELTEVKERKLEKFWEPTPFPLELQTQADHTIPTS